MGFSIVSELSEFCVAEAIASRSFLSVFSHCDLKVFDDSKESMQFVQIHRGSSSCMSILNKNY